VRYLAVIGFALVAAAIVACHRPSSGPAGGPAPAGSSKGVADEIQWFKGSVDEAFAAAAQQNKAVFVYYGAVWCPPCQELKAKVFHRKDFLERLQLFIPVYLDADAADSQRWAQQLHAVFMPTVLLLRADHSELGRASGGMNLRRYAGMLEDGVKAARPIEAILVEIKSGKHPLSVDDCRVLAFNNWQLDDAWNTSKSDWLDHMADVLLRAAQSCPAQARVERARLEITAASAAATVDAENIKSGKPTNPRLLHDIDVVREALNEPSVADETGDLVVLLPVEFFVAAEKLDARHAPEFLERVMQTLQKLEADSRYSIATQLFALDQQLALAKAVQIPPVRTSAIQAHARERVDISLRNTDGLDDRASVVNAAINVLYDLGEKDRVYSIVQAEVKTSPTPYYYMSELADLEEERGHPSVAVDWMARAYKEARGPATRLQWGARYIKGIVRLTPNDMTTIHATVLQVMSEAVESDNLYGRSRNSLQDIVDALRSWSEGKRHAGAIADVRHRLDLACQHSPSPEAGAACKQIVAEI
jgi:thiol-disulfide isomerase/thioredoxin